LGNLQGRNHTEDLNVDPQIVIRIDIGEIGWECMDLMHLDQDTDQWRAVVNTVMNLRVPYKAGDNSYR